MNVYFVYLLFGLNLMPIELVLSNILCKDSRIDSITYANDVQMYFLTSGGYYWWLKESDFPPPDSKAKRLPSPFVMGHAAVYVDSDSGCASAETSATEGIKSGEKEVWVEEYVEGQHKLMAFDTKKSVWRDNSIVYNKDHCISRARIDWASGKPLDAMFVRNYLEIYFVQDKDYSMVDCNFICSDPNIFGEDKPQYKTTDFHTVDAIYGMFVKRNKILFMFHLKTYYEMSIQPNSRNGRLVTIKGIKEKDIIKDFLKISNPGQCLEQTTQPPPMIEDKSERGGEEPLPAAGSVIEDKSSEDSGGSGGLIMLIVGIVIVVIAVIGAIAFFSIRSKSRTDEENKPEKAEKQKPPAVSPKPKTSAPTKAGPGVSAKKPTQSTIAGSSTITNKSNMDVVGIASKSLPSSKSSKSSSKK